MSASLRRKILHSQRPCWVCSKPLRNGPPGLYAAIVEYMGHDRICHVSCAEEAAARTGGRAMRFIVMQSPRPAEDSPEDIAHRQRCAVLNAALERIGSSILPGSPRLADELLARSHFAQAVLAGASIDGALAIAQGARGAH